MIVDIDNATLASVVVSIVNSLDCENEVLSIDAALATVANVLVTYNVPTSKLTLTGTATKAQYESILRSLKYINKADEVSPLPRIVQYTAYDGVAWSLPAFSAITFELRNDPPLLNPFGGQSQFTVLQDASDWVNVGVPVTTLVGPAMPVVTRKDRFQPVSCQDIGGCSWHEAAQRCTSRSLRLCTRDQISAIFPNGNRGDSYDYIYTCLFSFRLLIYALVAVFLVYVVHIKI
jgi:hypothetical protein